jgi:general nucleoside transport system ATP-binding protein
MNSPPLISLVRVSKRFGTTWANREISLEIREGEIHALVGENGAGKSTLMKMIFGHLQPDVGKILMRGRPAAFRHPREALDAGIGMVHQQLLIFPQLTALENIAVGAEPSGCGWFNRDKARRQVLALCRSFGFDLPLDRPTQDLCYAHRQQIEILRMLQRGAKILLLDEPTSLLAPPEVDHLLGLLVALRDQGHTVVFVSHRLHEVFALADRISVLAEGRLLATYVTAQTTIEQVAHRVVSGEALTCGRTEPQPALDQTRQIQSAAEQAAPVQAGALPATLAARPPVLVVEELSTQVDGQETALDRFTLNGVLAGEIFGICGIVGNGQRALARVLAGFAPLQSGRIYFQGDEVTGLSARQRARLGIGWLPANPLEEALLPFRPLWENLLLGRQRQAQSHRHGWLLQDKVKRWGEAKLAQYEVRYADLDDPLLTLSGGNQQKVALARVLSGRPRLLLLEQPMRGLDIGAQESLLHEIRRMSGEGVTFLLFSYDVNELLRICHRIGVLYRGRLAGLVNSAEATPAGLSTWMLGLTASPADPETNR